MNDIFVIGKTGQLSQCLQKLAPGFQYISKSELDLSNIENIHTFFKKKQPYVIVNLAAFTQVDTAESERELAKQINTFAPAALAQHCKYFLHISTDYVYDGESKIPYRETDPTNPINFYGKTKLAGEDLAITNNPNTIIIRTSWLYSEYGNNFVKSMLRLAKEKSSLSIVNDQIGSPTYAMDLAEALLFLLKDISKINPGVYHYSGEGSCTWYEFAKEILHNSPISISPITSSEYPTPAKRPTYSLLDKQKIKKELNITINQWQESLKKCLKNLS